METVSHPASRFEDRAQAALSTVFLQALGTVTDWPLKGEISPQSIPTARRDFGLVLRASSWV
jgi:hypothetical protein